jgi:hypothetical protein
MFIRDSRRSARLFRLFGSAFLPMFGLRGVHYEGDDGTGGTNGGTVTPTVTPTPTVAPTVTIDPERYGQAMKERKKAKSALRALVQGLGGDPDKIKLVSTGDPANPVRIEGIDDLDTRLAAGRAMAGVGGSGKSKGGQNNVDVATLTAQVAAYKRQVAALMAYIGRIAVVEPIRAECVRQHAIDDENGEFSDIVSALAPRFKQEIEFDTDDADAEPEVRIYPVDSSGQPLINPATAKPFTVGEMVADLLKRKPKLQEQKFRPGPGAGGNNVGGAKPGQNPSVRTVPQNSGDETSAKVRQARLLQQMTGGRITADQLLNSD